MENIPRRTQESLSWLLRAGDVLCIFTAGQQSSSVASDSAAGPAPFMLTYYLCATLGYFLLAQGAVRGASGLGRALLALLASWTMLAAIVMVIALPLFVPPARLGPLTWVALGSAPPLPWRQLAQFYVTGALALGLWRSAIVLVLQGLRHCGFRVKRIVLIGNGSVGREVRARACAHPWQRYDVVASWLDDADGHPGEPALTPGALQDLPDFVLRHRIAEVWIVLPLQPPGDVPVLQATLRNALVDVKVIPETYNLGNLSSDVVNLLGYTAIDLNRPGVSGMQALIKAALDRLFAALVLVALSPVLLAIAGAVRASSPGPVLFRQPRLGLNGKPFHVYKFRSMVVHHETGTLTQASADDHRITRVGRLLRRTSLDELPQFFNVLMGEMSVVGPRPHALPHNALYRDRLAVYMVRHRVKPGITGWAQINGLRGATDTDEKMRLRVQFDVHYIKHWSLWLDFKILVWTGLRGWSGSNAL
jgi:putative colanic acid biosynthesis UDP-glucose lipid carrier transferase